MNLRTQMVLFIVGVALAFVFICNAIPQIKIEAAGAEIEIGGSPDDVVAAGKRIFTSDRAQCLTCHTIGEDPKARCPNMEGIGERATTQRPGMVAAEYLVESTYNPNAFIVSGFPKNQMTPVNKPPIALSHEEIYAVIAFLNSQGGTSDEDFLEKVKKTQDPWVKGLLKPDVGEEEVVIPIFPGDPERGLKIFDREGCIACHQVGELGRGICPDLTSIGSSQSAKYILESIIEPTKVIVKGYNQISVSWDEDELDEEEEDFEDLRGTAVKWIPDQENPKKLIIAVQEGVKVNEIEVELSKVLALGDTWVGPKEDEGDEPICGNLLEGDAETGITLSMWSKTGWTKRTLATKEIEYVNKAQSPMPANFAETMTPGELYDLLAFLVEQKGGKETQ